ncbi:MAG: RepB family plasmid replication initiator protein [Hasllibacter sp.]
MEGPGGGAIAGEKPGFDPARLQGALRRPSVKKHVGAVHVAGKLTFLQRKLSNVLLTNAYDALKTRGTHSIDARTLMMMVGYNSNDVAGLKAALKGLVETSVEWDLLSADGAKEWGVSSLLAQAKLKGGVCEYAYAPALAEKLSDPDVFALINLDIQRRFASGHALALYENCYRFVRVRSTGWWPLGTFRKLMGVGDSAYYETFKHLNAKIIKPAVAEVNRTSNIHLTPELMKKGRAVTEIRFLIAENRQATALDLDGDDLAAGRVLARLKGQGIAERLAMGWIGELGAEEVGRRLDYVAGREGVRSPAAYLTAAMARGFGPPADPAPGGAGEAAPEVSAAAEAWRARQAEREAAEDARGREKAETMRRMGIVAAVAAARSPMQRGADRALFLGTLEEEADRAAFEQGGWSSRLLASRIFAFWEEMAPGLFDEG